MSVIRVVSYNIHKGRSALGRRQSLYELRLGLHGLRPDLVFLQEVQGRNEVSNVLHAQHESLAAGLHMEAAYGRNAIRAATDHGNALLSRFRILSYENQDISDHRMEQRGLLHALVQIKDQQVHCFVVHLGLFAGSRVRQIGALVDRIDQLVPDDAPLLIAGDFNDWKDTLSPLFVRRLGVYEVFAHAQRAHNPGLPTLRESVRSLRDALLHGQPRPGGKGPVLRNNQLGVEGAFCLLPPPRTFPAAFPWFRLDRIYQRGFAVRSARVLSGAPWRALSDHSPILAELELP
ncbi:endonuclease/exonuclease/phosphatase family protein [Orrella sp. JC864]|uniref:endonuclease/exonuclease/phosphatase family protein n=1 Tax=Orrella sp. JC864 TaxID=3120298 RepID=UPI0012BD3006